MVNFSCLLHGQWLMYNIFKVVSHPGQWLLVNDCFVQAKKTHVSYVHQWLESRKSNGQGYLYLMCVFCHQNGGLTWWNYREIYQISQSNTPSLDPQNASIQCQIRVSKVGTLLLNLQQLVNLNSMKTQKNTCITDGMVELVDCIHRVLPSYMDDIMGCYGLPQYLYCF